MKKNLFILLILIFCPCLLAAQTIADKDDFQSWNDVQLTVPMSKRIDFYASITERFGKNVTRVTESYFAIGFIYKQSKHLSFQPYYRSIEARNSRGQFRTEHRFSLRATYRFPFKKSGLSHRSILEYRMRQPKNSWRYRPSLTFEKDLPNKFIPKAKFFVTDEIFYDSQLKRFSRNRFSVGINKTLAKKLSLDVYYLRQNDGVSRPGDLSVIGSSWKIKL